MKLGYVIVYVEDVTSSIEFFEKAFGLKKRFIDDSGKYGELDTGQTKLAFIANELAKLTLQDGYRAVNASDKPLGMEIGLVTEDVKGAYDMAISCGAKSIATPVEKPWGQVMAYVMCPDGTLVELCSPI